MYRIYMMFISFGYYILLEVPNCAYHYSLQNHLRSLLGLENAFFGYVFNMHLFGLLLK